MNDLAKFVLKLMAFFAVVGFIFWALVSVFGGQRGSDGYDGNYDLAVIERCEVEEGAVRYVSTEPRGDNSFMHYQINSATSPYSGARVTISHVGDVVAVDCHG